MMLMIGAPSALAKSAYQSGYEHGVAVPSPVTALQRATWT